MMSNDTESASSSTTAFDAAAAARTHRAYLRPASSFLHFAANHRAVVATRRVVIETSSCDDVAEKSALFPLAAGPTSYRDVRKTRRCRRRLRTRTTPRSPRSPGSARLRNRFRRSRAMDARCVNSSCLQIKSVHAATRARMRTYRALTDRGVSATINTGCVIAATRVGSRTNRANTRKCDWR